MIWIFYNIVFVTVFTLLLPKFLLHMRKRGGYWKDFWQRLAFYSPNLKKRLATGGWYWVHGVSVGEVFVALKYMEAIRERHPDTKFVLTVTTSTGHKIAMDKLDERDVVLYFPVDVPVVVRRVLRIVKPCALALIETEIWPNLIRLSADRQMPIYMINGRMSDSSFRGYGKLKFFTARVLPLMERIFVQSELDRQRFESLGAPPDKVAVVGTAKYETAGDDESSAIAGRQILDEAGFGLDRLTILGASTWPGEEDALMDAYSGLKDSHPELFLVLAPRHAERRAEVLKAIEAKGMKVISRQDMMASNDETGKDCDVFLVDTTGELSCFYPHADLVFVGKSLTRHGGQNPLEPAVCGKPIIVGSNMENFRVVIDDLRQADAVVVVESESQLKEQIAALLSDPARRAQLGERARGVVAAKRGAIERTVELIGC